MMLRGGSRNVVRILPMTLFARLGSAQQSDGAAYHLYGSSQSFPTAAEFSDFGPRNLGAAVGPCPRACEQNAASKQVYGFSHPFDGTDYTFETLVSRTLGESLRGKVSVLGRSPSCSSALTGALCMDHRTKMPNSIIFHGRAPVRTESFQRESYSIHIRNLASATGKPFQQTYGKKPLDSRFSTDKTNEDKKEINKGDDKKIDEKSFGARLRNLLSDLENVPVPALGLGLAGAIPFVALTPGIASILPLPECLYNVHIEAQAAYGAVILTFLGGPHWGLAMSDNGGSAKSVFSRISIRTLRYVWSVVPSLVAWPALLLSPVPQFVILITSFGLVCGVDAFFTRIGLLPNWYMPLRILLTSIAMLSMTSSLIVTAAMNAAAAVTQ